MRNESKNKNFLGGIVVENVVCVCMCVVCVFVCVCVEGGGGGDIG